LFVAGAPFFFLLMLRSVAYATRLEA
jgi:hypothetical protein